MIKLKLFQSEWEALYNYPIQYYIKAAKIATITNKDRITKAFFYELPKLEKKVFTAKNKAAAKLVNLDYFEALALLELLKQYPINVKDEWLYTLVNMCINFLDHQL